MNIRKCFKNNKKVFAHYFKLFSELVLVPAALLAVMF